MSDDDCAVLRFPEDAVSNDIGTGGPVNKYDSNGTFVFLALAPTIADVAATVLVTYLLLDAYNSWKGNKRCLTNQDPARERECEEKALNAQIQCLSQGLDPATCQEAYAGRLQLSPPFANNSRPP
jgi:hypothetical protein